MITRNPKFLIPIAKVFAIIMPILLVVLPIIYDYIRGELYLQPIDVAVEVPFNSFVVALPFIIFIRFAQKTIHQSIGNAKEIVFGLIGSLIMIITVVTISFAGSMVYFEFFGVKQGWQDIAVLFGLIYLLFYPAMQFGFTLGALIGRNKTAN